MAWHSLVWDLRVVVVGVVVLWVELAVEMLPVAAAYRQSEPGESLSERLVAAAALASHLLHQEVLSAFDHGRDLGSP